MMAKPTGLVRISYASPQRPPEMARLLILVSFMWEVGFIATADRTESEK